MIFDFTSDVIYKVEFELLRIANFQHKYTMRLLLNKTVNAPTIVLLTIAGGVSLLLMFSSSNSSNSRLFDGERAYKHVVYQTGLGPRTIGSEAHAATIDYIQTELERNDWDVTVQETNRLSVKIQNIIGKRGVGEPWIILAAHYDSRLLADEDPDPEKNLLPVMGANDGASGVSVLLELSRVLSKTLDMDIWLVFFDAEDNGNIQGQDWILGSRAFVDNLEEKPDAVVIIDMIGDRNLNLYWEHNSNIILNQELWDTALELGYTNIFIPEYKYKIIDDHVPFVRAGIPAIDIIDFDYPYYHTSQDTLDKVSPESLEVIGNTLIHWLEQKASK
jgi:Zn-dependent M28 family amino/carboxypeptidase